jgi:translation initiation factor IF-3
MIRLSPVRLIDENNQQVGVVETPEALARAREAGLDLVEIQPDARPPLCKIMDYGKYKYEQSKKEQKSRASQKSQEMKEVRLGRSIKVDPHDIGIRIDRARKFLLQGHKVMLVQQFRGREVVHADLGEDILRDVVEALEDIAKIDTPPRKMGRRMSMILSPDKPKVEAYKRKQDKAKKDEEDAKAKAAAEEAASEAEAESADESSETEGAEAETSESKSD